jgi:hypothetical protein
MRTGRVKELVEEVLYSLPKPHTEDVIDDVFEAIEQRPEWRRQYDDLTHELGKAAVNSWGGFWIAHSERRWGTNQVPARKSKLLDSYSKLDKAGSKPGKKVKEPAALTMMSNYYRENKNGLPKSIVAHREVIIDLLMEGFTAEEAFSKVGRLAT